MRINMRALTEVFKFLFGDAFIEIEVNRISDDTNEIEYTPMGHGGALGIDIIYNEQTNLCQAVNYYYQPMKFRGEDGGNWEPVASEWRKSLFMVAKDIMEFKMNEELQGLGEALAFIEMEEMH